MQHAACSERKLDLDSTLRMFRELPIGVAVWQLRDPKSVRSFRLIGVNPAAEREVRAQLDYAVGKSITESFPKLLETQLPDRWRRVLLTGKAETLGEFAYGDPRIPEGVFWVECFPLSDECVGVAMENITERKRTAENQFRALQLLSSITVHLNETATVLEAAQFCVDEICAQIKWPVGRFFLSDNDCPSRFLPNPVWHLSDAHRFHAFRKATELYERDLTNKLALEYRSAQGRRAGLKRSIGFSVRENDFLRGVLEFSSEDAAPLDVNIFRAISNVGFQLGHVFARERIGRESIRDRKTMVLRDLDPDAIRKLQADAEWLVSAVRSSCKTRDSFSQTRKALSKELLAVTRELRKGFDESLRLLANPTECPMNIAS